VNLVDMRKAISDVFTDIFAEHYADKPIPNLTDDAVLLETGMDSLGFAMLVVQLEDTLGFDPFTESDESYYPQTFQDFVEFYHRNQPE
jgi:acyl carrier protein